MVAKYIFLRAVCNIFDIIFLYCGVNPAGKMSIATRFSGVRFENIGNEIEKLAMFFY
jgi:hypothetical protein